MRINHIFHRNIQKKGGEYYWKSIELITLTVGTIGTIIACLINYNWQLFRESLFILIWSVIPYILIWLGNHIVYRIVRTYIIQSITALFTVLLTILSLRAYIGAVLNPNHSSGMIFVILPMYWIITIPVFLTVITIGYLAVIRWRKH